MTETPKLVRLKAWLPIAEAAAYLSNPPHRQVSPADVLRFGLDGHLRLSVRFLQPIHGQPADSPDALIEPLDFTEVFDLPMVAGERLIVEEAYQCEIGRSDLALSHPEGTFVEDFWGDRYRLFNAKYQLLTRLPAYAVLVVRREVLDRFLPLLASDERDERPLDKRERDTLYVMIAALCSLAKLDVRRPSRVAEAIEAETARLGNNIAPRTVQHHLKGVREMFGER